MAKENTKARIKNKPRNLENIVSRQIGLGPEDGSAVKRTCRCSVPSTYRWSPAAYNSSSGDSSPSSGLPGSWHAYGADIDNHAHMYIKNK